MTIPSFDFSFVELRALLDQVRRYGFDRNPAVELVWLLPNDRMPGVTRLDDLEVERYNGPPRLAFKEREQSQSPS